MGKLKAELAFEDEDGNVTKLNDIPCEDKPCYRCGKAPEGGAAWYTLIERDGKQVGVYTCDDCMDASGKPVQ